MRGLVAVALVVGLAAQARAETNPRELADGSTITAVGGGFVAVSILAGVVAVVGATAFQFSGLPGNKTAGVSDLALQVGGGGLAVAAIEAGVGVLLVWWGRNVIEHATSGRPAPVAATTIPERTRAVKRAVDPDTAWPAHTVDRDTEPDDEDEDDP